MKSLKEDPKPKIVLLLFGTLFAYGFLHALGPGHGKLFIFSYVVSKKIRLLNACLIGTIVAFFHASLSVVLVVVLDLILEKSVLLSVDRAEYWLKIISYFLVLALGGYLMYHALSHFKSPDTHHRKNSKEEKKDRNFVMMAISIAMVPCPGTILILLFAMSNQLFGLGLLSVACMAAGMAVSLSLISTTTAFAREKGIGLIVHSEKMQDRVSGIATFAGSVIIVLTSIVMLAGTIRI